MSEKKVKPQIEWFRNGAIEAWCPDCKERVYGTHTHNEFPKRCPQCDVILDWSDDEPEPVEVLKYNAVAVSTGKTVEGYPVVATSGKTYMIILMDDDALEAVRFMYAEIYPESLAVME